MKYSIILLALLLSACTATRYSNKSAGEQLQLTKLEFNEPLQFNDLADKYNINKDASRGLLTTDLLLRGVDFAFDGIKTAIKKSTEKYHQEYFLSLYNNSFYAKNSQLGMLDPENIKFKGFEITRNIALEDGRELALKACFSLDESKIVDIYTQSKFYLKCDSLIIDYAKVKMNDKKWFLPWTLFMKKQEEINVDIDIDIKANWLDQNGVIHKHQDFGKFHFPIRNYKVGTADSSYSGNALSGYCYLIPRSATYCVDQRNQWKPCFGQGDFDILVKVTESSKNNKLNKLIYDNIDVLDDVDATPVKGFIK